MKNSLNRRFEESMPKISYEKQYIEMPRTCKDSEIRKNGMQRWKSVLAPSHINPTLFDPNAMFPPVEIPEGLRQSSSYFSSGKRPPMVDVPRRIYLIRNGESVRSETENCSRSYHEYNEFLKIDVGQAITKITRSNSNDSYDDPPLTQIGYSGAQLVGRSLSNKNLNIHTVYTSPSLRCIQTAISISSSINFKKRPRIRIEYALFEPKITSRKHKFPHFMSGEELIYNGYYYDEKYVPIIEYSELERLINKEKRVTDFYTRVKLVVNRIIASERKTGGVIVISHAPIIDCLFRLLTERTDLPQTVSDVNRLVHNFPRCSVTTMEFNRETAKWENRDKIVPPLSYWHMTTMMTQLEFVTICDSVGKMYQLHRHIAEENQR